MTRDRIEIGHVYQMRVSGRITNVRVESIKQRVTGRGSVYTCTNLQTGRTCVAYSASKFRSAVQTVKGN